MSYDFSSQFKVLSGRKFFGPSGGRQAEQFQFGGEIHFRGDGGKQSPGLLASLCEGRRDQAVGDPEEFWWQRCPARHPQESGIDFGRGIEDPA